MQTALFPLPPNEPWVLPPLHHLFEQAWPVIHPLSTATEAAETRVSRHLALTWTQSAATEELLR
jgi:hypothetical protein